MQYLVSVLDRLRQEGFPDVQEDIPAYGSSSVIACGGKPRSVTTKLLTNLCYL